MELNCPQCKSINTEYYGEHEDQNASWFVCEDCGQFFLEENNDDNES